MFTLRLFLSVLFRLVGFFQFKTGFFSICQFFSISLPPIPIVSLSAGFFQTWEREGKKERKERADLRSQCFTTQWLLLCFFFCCCCCCCRRLLLAKRRNYFPCHFFFPFRTFPSQLIYNTFILGHGWSLRDNRIIFVPICAQAINSISQSPCCHSKIQMKCFLSFLAFPTCARMVVRSVQFVRDTVANWNSDYTYYLLGNTFAVRACQSSAWLNHSFHFG